MNNKRILACFFIKCKVLHVSSGEFYDPLTIHDNFSICEKSNSTGVSLPNILT